MDLFPPVVLMGVGAGVCFPALTSVAMSGADASGAGLASGLINTTGQVVGAHGLAVLATVSSELTRGLRAAGRAVPEVLTGGHHLAFWIAAELTCGAVKSSRSPSVPDPPASGSS